MVENHDADESMAMMSAILEASNDAILVTDQKGNITAFNEKFLTTWQMRRSMLRAGTADEARLFAGQQFDDPQYFAHRIEEITRSGRESFDQLVLKDGRIIERNSRLLMVNGRELGRVWSFRDISDRHAAEITSHLLAAIVESSDDAIIGKDLTSTVTSWNAGAERIFGYTAEEMIGCSIMRLIPPDRQEEEKEILAKIRQGERMDHFETVRVAKGGQSLFLSITVSPIKDSTGRVIGASKVARDITERKLAEAALSTALLEAEEANRERLQLLASEREARSQAERASRMKDDFLATLSHELRTPLNAVLGWASIIRHSNLQGEELRQGLETIERNARSQAQIIEDLLDMSRIVSGKVRLDVQQVDLPRVLADSFDTVRTAAQAKGVTLLATGSTSLDPITGDPDRLQQIFWNLLTNAIKFTPKQGVIEVRLENRHSHLEVSVSDTGEGIAPEFLPHVFDRFQQSDASTTRRHGGLGLGLAIVKQLVELHGGTVRVKSEGLGHGSTFIVQLPICAEETDPDRDERRHPVAGSREAQPFPEISLQGIHVVVVDDEPDVRALVKRLLEMAGATVALAASAAEAMPCMTSARPHVLICDIGMPEEDGYSLIRRLRALEEFSPELLPAISLTAYARAEDRTKAIHAGFQNHLAKPVDPGELLAVVSSLARRRSPL
ncbi:hypothetical protein BH09VER1_BH09VER1_54400 [soil metagenome]